MKYLLTINNEVLEKYNEHYFKKYPGRRKIPIEKPISPSLNQWMVMLRPAMNGQKQVWKEFIVWLVEYYGLTNKKIEKAVMTFTYYFPTKARHDADNYTPKNIMDGFTESGMLIDDDFSHIQMLCIKGGYDKENPRTEILIEEID